MRPVGVFEPPGPLLEARLVLQPDSLLPQVTQLGEAAEFRGHRLRREILAFRQEPAERPQRRRLALDQGRLGFRPGR